MAVDSIVNTLCLKNMRLLMRVFNNNFDKNRPIIVILGTLITKTISH